MRIVRKPLGKTPKNRDQRLSKSETQEGAQ
jgi:hypothetical protein